MKILNVYLKERIIGKLIQNNAGEMQFVYSNDWIDDPHAIAISCSLPLKPGLFERKQCAFFEGLLPEQTQRKIIARNLSISEKNDFSMLEKIGGECAGALSFVPEGEKIHGSDRDPRYHTLGEKALVEILKELPAKPMLAGDRGVRLSLAGVQDKLAVFVNHEEIAIPLNNEPSTHILKPTHHRYPDVIFNEYFCLKLAEKIGLSVAVVDLKQAENISYLLVKRFDRVMDNQLGIIERIHQEDFCQALGVPSTQKYQNEQGPSLKQCFGLIREYSSIPAIDLERLLEAVIFNYLIGNCDAHGKNFSLLHEKQNIRLAPLYDLICTLHYSVIDKKMAMKIGGEYHIEKIGLIQFDRFSEEVGLSRLMVRKKIVLLCNKIKQAIDVLPVVHDSQSSIALLIRARCNRVLEKSA